MPLCHSLQNFLYGDLCKMPYFALWCFRYISLKAKQKDTFPEHCNEKKQNQTTFLFFIMTVQLVWLARYTCISFHLGFIYRICLLSGTRKYIHFCIGPNCQGSLGEHLCPLGEHRWMKGLCREWEKTKHSTSCIKPCRTRPSWTK